MATMANYRLREPLDNWPAGSILRVTRAEAWPVFRHLAERVSDEAVWNFEFDAGFHAEMQVLQNRQPAAAPVAPIRHDRLLEMFGWDDAAYAAALRIGFPRPGDSGTGTAAETHGIITTCRWTTYAPNVINDWLHTVHTFGSTLPKEI
jgi:hypothetical protein